MRSLISASALPTDWDDLAASSRLWGSSSCQSLMATSCIDCEQLPPLRCSSALARQVFDLVEAVPVCCVISAGRQLRLALNARAAVISIGRAEGCTCDRHTLWPPSTFRLAPVM